jgi:hypothetical protein
MLVRIPRELHGQLARLAKSENVSLNHYIVYLLTSASTRHKLEAVTHIAYGGVPATGFVYAGVSVTNFGHMTTLSGMAQPFEVGELALVGTGSTARRNMAEPTQFSFDLKELTTALIKEQDLHEGLGWRASISLLVRG